MFNERQIEKNSDHEWALCDAQETKFWVYIPLLALVASNLFLIGETQGLSLDIEAKNRNLSGSLDVWKRYVPERELP